jgi:pilus assembly protein Flp/PilA
MNKLAEFLADESGATAIEYGLVAAMIAVGIIVALTSFGSSLLGLFNYVSERSQTAMGS